MVEVIYVGPPGANCPAVGGVTPGGVYDVDEDTAIALVESSKQWELADESDAPRAPQPEADGADDPDDAELEAVSASRDEEDPDA